jgi:Domain of unknown function (DUF4272)
VLSRLKRRPTAPDRDAVIDRALCLAAVAMLGAIATAVEEGAMDRGQAGEYLRETHRWLIREQLAPALSVGERALLAKSLSDWTPREALGASWRNEALGVLLWALGAFDELPPYDARFEQLPSLVPLLAPTAEFRHAATLRSPEELERARCQAELWHWRARMRQLQERGETGADLDSVRLTTAKAHDDGLIPAPIDGDFPAFGEAYRALDAEQAGELTSGAGERHYALNWLCGRAADWDKVPTET